MTALLPKMWQHQAGRLGLLICTSLILLALLAPLLSPVDPIKQNPESFMLPPMWMEGGHWPYVLGTDDLGRDLLSRIMHGARLSLFIGVISVGLGAAIGIPLGLCAGYFGGRIDSTVMRFIDILLALPSLLLAICIVTVLGPSLINAMIAIGLVAVPNFARVVRASVLAEKEKEYVTADRALGKRTWPIMFYAILPNVYSPLLVMATLGFATAVLEAAGLSFLGLGAQPPTPEWGALLAEGKAYMYQAWWLMFFPGLAILMTVVGFNVLGDALRDITSPRS